MGGSQNIRLQVIYLFFLYNQFTHTSGLFFNIMVFSIDISPFFFFYSISFDYNFCIISCQKETLENTVWDMQVPKSNRALINKFIVINCGEHKFVSALKRYLYNKSTTNIKAIEQITVWSSYHKINIFRID